MDIKSLNFCQVYWAQKLSQYYFQINYCQEKTNTVTDALLRFFQTSSDKEEIFWDENIQILKQL